MVKEGKEYKEKCDVGKEWYDISSSFLSSVFIIEFMGKDVIYEVEYKKLKEYGLEDALKSGWVGAAIKSGVEPNRILLFVSVFAVISAVYIPRFFVFNDVLHLTVFFISLFGFYIVFSMVYSEALMNLFKIDSLLKDKEFQEKNNININWTSNQLATFGCILMNPGKFGKPELSKRLGLSERQIHTYSQNGLIERKGYGFFMNRPVFKIIDYTPTLSEKISGVFRNPNLVLRDFFELRCIIQYLIRKKNGSTLRKT